MEKTQVYIAGALTNFAVLALAGVAYLVFVFPKTLAIWADEGRALTIIEQNLANLSNLCASLGLLIIPALLLAVVGCGIWTVMAGRNNA
jgi:type II secretory pathway component PulF